MKQPTELPKYPDDEISLKDFLIKIADWWRYLLSKWKIIVLFGILGAALGLLYAFTREVKYKGELTFILEESKSSGLGSYAAIASQIGIDLGGNSTSGLFTEDNIIGFLKSRFIVEKTLLSPIHINNREITIAEYYIEFNKLREKWKDSNIKKINYPVNYEREKFSLKQDSILNTLYETIVKYELLVLKPDKKVSFIAIKCYSTNELFAKLFVETLLKEATSFYVSTKTQRSRANLAKLQATADSIELLLNRRTYSAAALQDINKNPARNIASVSTEVAIRDKSMLQIMYAEVVKNLEVARMTMMQETPVIQIIDSPILPLAREKFGKLKGIVLGGILGGLLITLFLLIRKILKDVMQ